MRRAFQLRTISRIFLISGLTLVAGFQSTCLQASELDHACLIHRLKQGLASSAAPISIEKLVSEIALRRARVPEFEFIRKEAEMRGLRVWLFGGTAAGYGHYVKWDLRREAGDLRFQPERFDYDYTNIYRSTQDLDIVVNGSAAEAQEFQRALKAQFPYFMGSKATPWEVRSLTEARDDKGALLDDFGFMNQHTDSNSTGMIELTDPPKGESIVRDLRDWKNAKNSQFLKDLHEDALTYYFSPTHEQTERARAGKNPPIFSIVRALTKAFQYDLKIKPEDLKIMRREIERFEPLQDLRSPDAAYWIEKNGKKLYQHAVDIEYASDTLQDLGLKQKLIAINGDPHELDSLAWWMNKEPLRSKPVGMGNGKTASELGLDLVAHETNHFLAYESITRAHTGAPNVLISRQQVTGELAAYGDGFYTKIGEKGARGTGITIRFKVDPQAREGTDFEQAGDFIIWKNKNAIRVIPESLNLSPSEYFAFLAQGKTISKDDQALIWKLKQRLDHSLVSGIVDPEELKKVRKIVVNQMKSKARNRELLFHEWIRFEGTRAGKPKQDIDALIDWLKRKSYRADPARTINALLHLSYGTEANEWMSREFIPSLLKGIKPDFGESAIQNCLMSSHPELWSLGLQGLVQAESVRSLPLTRALRHLVDASRPGGPLESQTIERWLRSAHSPADEKAAFLLSQIGEARMGRSYQEWLKEVPASQRESVGREIAKISSFPVFQRLAQKKNWESALETAKPESFQFVSFKFPKEGKTFQMGSRDDRFSRANEALRTVTIDRDYEFQATPLTELQMALIMGEDPSGLAAGGNLPANYVSWEEGRKLIEKLNRLDPAHTYRYATEAEWEYAARAGTKTRYSFGNSDTRHSEYGWGSENSGGTTHPVASLKPNPAGIYDVHGNVYEWVQDFYTNHPPGGLNPQGLVDTGSRVKRGGSAAGSVHDSRSSSRGAVSSEISVGTQFEGVRLVRVPKKQ